MLPLVVSARYTKAEAQQLGLHQTCLGKRSDYVCIHSFIYQTFMMPLLGVGHCADAVAHHHDVKMNKASSLNP